MTGKTGLKSEYSNILSEFGKLCMWKGRWQLDVLRKKEGRKKKISQKSG